MADISKCNNRQCKKRKSCFRYLADANEYRQSYLTITDPEKCNAYWEVKDRYQLRELADEFKD